MTDLELGLLVSCGLLAGGLLGAVRELMRLHRTCMRAWMYQGAAQSEATKLREALAEANKRIGALQATRGEVLETAVGVAKLAQLDALQQPKLSESSYPGPSP